MMDDCGQDIRHCIDRCREHLLEGQDALRKERDEARAELDRCRAILASLDGCHADELDLDRVERLVVAGEWP